MGSERTPDDEAGYRDFVAREHSIPCAEPITSCAGQENETGKFLHDSSEKLKEFEIAPDIDSFSD